MEFIPDFNSYSHKYELQVLANPYYVVEQAPVYLVLE